MATSEGNFRRTARAYRASFPAVLKDCDRGTARSRNTTGSTDSLAERSEFELPVPVSKLPDDSIMLSFATSRQVVKRSHPGPHL